MAAIPPLSSLKTITHVTSHGSSVTPGDANLGGAGAVTVATDLGPQPGEVALGPGDLLNNLTKEIVAFHDSVNKWASKNSADFYTITAAAGAAVKAWQKYGSQITEAIQKYGSQVAAVLGGLANGTLKVVGGVLEGVGSDMVPPIIIDPQTLGGMNNTIAALGGSGSLTAQAFAAGVAGVASSFNGVG